MCKGRAAIKKTLSESGLPKWIALETKAESLGELKLLKRDATRGHIVLLKWSEKWNLEIYLWEDPCIWRIVVSQELAFSTFERLLRVWWEGVSFGCKDWSHGGRKKQRERMTFSWTFNVLWKAWAFALKWKQPFKIIWSSLFTISLQLALIYWNSE